MGCRVVYMNPARLFGMMAGLILCVLLLVPGLALATGLASADTNHDGKISRAEANAARDRAFKKMDTNHDGHLNFQEFSAGQPKLGGNATPSARQRRKRIIHQWFDHIDANGNGQISMQEYRKAMAPYFNRLDTNHNGVLSASELRSAFAGQKGAGKGSDASPSSSH